MDVNELVTDFPFGEPTVPVVGFGGKYGAELLSKSAGFIDCTVKEVMVNLKDQYLKQSEGDLKLLGLEKDTDGTIIVVLNGRPITTCDAEHGCCLQYTIVERRVGGSKGLSDQPNFTMPYCHPIPQLEVCPDIAVIVIEQFTTMVKDGSWGIGGDSDPHDNKVDVDETDSDQSSKGGRDMDDNDETTTSEEDIGMVPTGEESSDGSDDTNEDEGSYDNSSEGGEVNISTGPSMGKEDSEGVEDEDNETSGTSEEDLTTGPKAEEDSSCGEEVDASRVTQKVHRAAHRQGMGLPTRKRFRPEVCGKMLVHQAARLPTGTGQDVIDCGTLTNIGSSKITRVKQRWPKANCNLFLGMIYGNMVGTVQQIGRMTQYTTQLRRDTARCIATEKDCGKACYTVDCRSGGDGSVHRTDRHIVSNMSNLDINNRLLDEIKGSVSQVCLDHFWFSGVYWDERGTSKDFILKSLPVLWELLVPGGVIYLPLSVQVFIRVLTNEDTVSKLFLISLTHSDDVLENDLVKGSHCISDHFYKDPNMFGSKNQKPESTLGTSTLKIKQTASEVDDVLKLVSRFEQLTRGRNEEQFQFLKLLKIR